MPELSAAASDGQLHDAALRALRQPIGRVAVVLHLSRLPPPGARPHHRRVARALMQDTATRFDGQVFERHSGDLVLLCRRGQAKAHDHWSSDPRAHDQRAKAAVLKATTAEPLDLPSVFARLLRADVSDPARFVSVWSLERESEVLLAYTATRVRGSTTPQQREDFAGQTTLVDALGRVMDQVNLGDVVQRQTAILLRPGEREGVTPLFREMSLAVPALQARLAESGQSRIDPFLFRHLAARLDQRMLAGVTASLGRGGPLDPTQFNPSQLHQTPAEPGAMPLLQLNLTVSGLLSPAFAGLTQACRAASVRLAIGVDVMEAAADQARFDEGRARIVEAGFTFVLSGVSHLALLITDPAPWQPDLLKLDWSPRLPDLPPGDGALIDTAVAEIGADRIVLKHADSEAALHWGLARGIARFQGRHVDMMLGAGRMVACPGATGCTLRQCIERAGTIAASGRAGCTNVKLLDQASPFPAHAVPTREASSSSAAPSSRPAPSKVPA